MPYLNWKNRPDLQIETPEVSGESPYLVLGLDSKASRLLAEELSPIVEGRDKELRWDLPQGWTLFWKLREGESRLLLAHPERDQWVGTLALNKSHALAVQMMLQNDLAPGFNVDLQSLGVCSAGSNLRIILKGK